MTAEKLGTVIGLLVRFSVKATLFVFACHFAAKFW